MKNQGDFDAFINDLIRRGISFAMYRLPGTQMIEIVVQQGPSVRLLYDIEELNGKEGFVIAPFKVGSNAPVLLISPDRQYSINMSDIDYVLPDHVEEVSVTTCTDAYTSGFNTFMEALRQNEFDKLVLSRSRRLKVADNFSLANAILFACKRYQYSYFYLFYTPRTGVWLGCTPEILLSGQKGEWKTVALAGTQSLQNGCLPLDWDEKNRREQEYVSAYIRSQLLSCDIEFTESAPCPVYAGALSHLCADFRFSLPDEKRLGSLLKLLHPTPAVCGLPKEKAYQFILDNEGYDRQYYSGFVGMIDFDKTTDLYVNLRCMNLERNEVTLYAGGGLLASSELNDEWTETEKKMQTMKNLIMC